MSLGPWARRCLKLLSQTCVTLDKNICYINRNVYRYCLNCTGYASAYVHTSEAEMHLKPPLFSGSVCWPGEGWPLSTHMTETGCRNREPLVKHHVSTPDQHPKQHLSAKIPARHPTLSPDTVLKPAYCLSCVALYPDTVSQIPAPSLNTACALDNVNLVFIRYGLKSPCETVIKTVGLVLQVMLTATRTNPSSKSSVPDPSWHLPFIDIS